MMDLLAFVDELAPRHERTSCNDDNLNGNQYFNEMGYPRCTRCALLHRVREGEWPHGAKIEHTGVQFAVEGGDRGR